MASGGADSFRGRGSRPILQFCCLCMAMPPLAAAFMHQLPSSSVKACRDGRGISTVSETHESHRRFDEFCHHVQAEQQESPVKDRGSSTYFRIDGEGRGESLMSSVDELVLSRRKMLSLGALLFLGGFLSAPSSSFGRDLLEVDGSDGLVWSPKGEILERAESAGGRSAPAKNSTYGPRFIAYLSRFLLNYDSGSRQLWKQEAGSIPRTLTPFEMVRRRKEQFASFSGAVQVGLLDYQGPDGVRALFSLLRSRYGRDEERKRQLAILFSFVSRYQPVEGMEQLMGEVDNAFAASILVASPGSGYTGRPPAVLLSPPQAENGVQATGKAILGPTGEVSALRLTQVSCEYFYSMPPEIRISPPPASEGAKQATAQAVLGDNGLLLGIRIADPGAGYNDEIDPVTVQVYGLPDAVTASEGEAQGSETCDVYPEVEAILNRCVKSIEIVNPGSGYATSVPMSIVVESPVDCGGELNGEQALAVGFVEARSGPSLFSDERESSGIENNGEDSEVNRLMQEPALLLPSSVAYSLVVDSMTGKYEAADLSQLLPSPQSAVFDPVFGPIGRSPLDREVRLGPESYLRLASSGALCNGIVRFILHPVDNVKTQLQANPVAASEGLLPAIKTMSANGGGKLVKGLDISAILGLLLGFFGFGCNELFRRQLTAFVGPTIADSNLVGIILLASAGSQIVNTFVVCPWEAMRIRVMCAEGNDGFRLGSFLPAGQTILAEEGVWGFYSALPTLLFRELPFAACKFLVFELVRNELYEIFPLAGEGGSSGLLVSLVAGMAAGIAGAVVSNPADAILTRLKTQSAATGGAEVSWQEVVRDMQGEPGGLSNLLRGLGLRALFFGSSIALQFLTYDYFKTLLGVGPDDLQQVLDVFKDRLSFYD